MVPRIPGRFTFIADATMQTSQVARKARGMLHIPIGQHQAQYAKGRDGPDVNSRLPRHHIPGSAFTTSAVLMESHSARALRRVRGYRKSSVCESGFAARCPAIARRGPDGRRFPRELRGWPAAPVRRGSGLRWPLCLRARRSGRWADRRAQISGPSATSAAFTTALRNSRTLPGQVCDRSTCMAVGEKRRCGAS